jgi:hypothetical protein
MKYYIFLGILLTGFVSQAQVDTTASDEDEFDFSDFEPAAPPAKAYCTNKVLGQSPTSLLGIYYNHQFPHTLEVANNLDQNAPSRADAEIAAAQQIAFVGNFPLISRNNILINLGVTYQQQRYTFDNTGSNAFAQSLEDNTLHRGNITATLFKPLNSKNFVLIQAQTELNGDYTADNIDFGNLRFPIAALYGWKSNDRLMYGFGLSRTYLGGALNYVPIIYYYHTFQNQKWGIEALLPARALLRYRFNSLSYAGIGFNVNGASYSLDTYQSSLPRPFNIGSVPVSNDLELRRSEIRAGLQYARQLSGFFWMSVEAGYRINYSYSVDQGGDFLRFFGSDDPYLFENGLGNTPYFTIGLSYVSP